MNEPKTIRVRIAVAVAPDGSWAADGFWAGEIDWERVETDIGAPTGAH